MQVPIATPARGDISSPSKRGALWVVVTVAAILVLTVALRLTDSSQDDSLSDRQQQTTVPATTEEAKPVVPPFSGVTLHPYDLLKNPYKFKNNMVVLDVVSRPVLYNGSIVQYAEGYIDPRPGNQLSQTGLRFQKMVSQDTGLYDIMGLEGNFNASSDSDLLGEIAVFSSTENGELELDRPWKVEPLGTLQGTNALGAALEVPLVRFWGYAGQSDTPSTPPE